jgi:hypothetical protein
LFIIDYILSCFLGVSCSFVQFRTFLPASRDACNRIGHKVEPATLDSCSVLQERGSQINGQGCVSLIINVPWTFA